MLNLSHTQMRRIKSAALSTFEHDLYREFRRQYSEISDPEFRDLFERTAAGCRSLDLKFRESIRQIFFLSFEQRRPVTDLPDFCECLRRHEAKGYPPHEVIDSLTRKVERDKQVS